MIKAKQKKFVFLLPVDNSLPSIKIRATDLLSYFSVEYKPSIINIKKITTGNIRGIRRLFELINTIQALYKSSKEAKIVYVIKPKSWLAILIGRLFLKIKIIIDVNDVYHLSNQVGIFRTMMLMLVSNHVVFEEDEYKKKWKYIVRDKNCSIIADSVPNTGWLDIEWELRDKNIIWFGSPQTSATLLYFKNMLKQFSEKGYKLYILGGRCEIVKELSNYISIKNIEKYNTNTLTKYISSSRFSLIPYFDEADKCRGSLKFKLSLAGGAIPIASDIEMHRSVVNNEKISFLIKGEDIKSINLNCMMQENLSKWSAKGQNYARNKFDRQDQAVKICSVISSLYK